MFGYRHGFHAGNFADVFKHVILIQLLKALKKKEKPFFVLDSHGGAGRYNLRSAEAQKVGEYREGIGRLWQVAKLAPELKDYQQVIQSFNKTRELLSYPGSPQIIEQFLRKQDRQVVCELNPREHPVLTAAMADSRQTNVLLEDAYKALKSQIPPIEGRGLVFMDPSFEMAGEFQRLQEAAALLKKRWQHGTLAIWYPILDREPSARFHKALKKLDIANLLCVELGITEYGSARGMHGCGMVIVNPPWQLDTTLERVLPQLQRYLAPGDAGQIRLEWFSRS
ncbi:MAG: 23S rRNA (adenine2030-N6)-methyltransferase [Bermanella sp.]|jgi:23S rRNA (adenine2030-N6)-methyltransferase